MTKNKKCLKEMLVLIAVCLIANYEFSKISHDIRKKCH